MDVIVRTYNSGGTVERCLKSITEKIPLARIIVVDRNSEDGTLDACRRYGATLILEDAGLGKATSIGIAEARTDLVLFVDSDVEVIRGDFVQKGANYLEDSGIGAVVGVPPGHPFSYGLPLGMTLFRLSDISAVRIPEDVLGSETYFIRKRLRSARQRVRYIKDSMHHQSPYRGSKSWPEWQGAQVRRAAGLNPREVLYSALVIFLMLSNSKSLKNMAYTPIFFVKFLRGFARPSPWYERKRSGGRLI